MAHLPQNIREMVDPFIRKLAMEYYHYAIFDVVTYNKNEQYNEYEEEDLLENELSRYHYWFKISEEPAYHFIDTVEKAIAKFNKIQSVCSLVTSMESGGNRRRICCSDSDNYGAQYCLISVCLQNDETIVYTLPLSVKNEMSVMEYNKRKKKYAYYYKETNQNIIFNFVEDDVYYKENTLFCRYTRLLYRKDKHDCGFEEEISELVKLLEPLNIQFVEYDFDTIVCNDESKKIGNDELELETITDLLNCNYNSNQFIILWNRIQKKRNRTDLLI